MGLARKPGLKALKQPLYRNLTCFQSVIQCPPGRQTRRRNMQFRSRMTKNGDTLRQIKRSPRPHKVDIRKLNLVAARSKLPGNRPVIHTQDGLCVGNNCPDRRGNQHRKCGHDERMRLQPKHQSTQNGNGDADSHITAGISRLAPMYKGLGHPRMRAGAKPDWQAKWQNVPSQTFLQKPARPAAVHLSGARSGRKSGMT